MDGDQQRVSYVQLDATDRKQSEQALEKAREQCGGQVPDYVFICAGIYSWKSALNAHL